MSGSAGFTGYPNDVFQVCTIACAYLTGQISGQSSATASVALAQNVFSTLRNGQQAVAAWQVAGAWTTELALLQQVQVLPLSLSATQSAAFSARITALQNAIAAIQLLIPAAAPANTIASLQANAAAIAYPGILEFYQGFNYESQPSGYTPDQTDAYAMSNAADWAGIASAVSDYQTTLALTQGYDECTRIAAALNEISSVCDELTADLGLSFAYPDALTPLAAWNQNVALPAMLCAATSITSAPSSSLNQQCGVIRTVIGTSINAIALYLLALRQPSFGQANLATLQANDSLLDLAARTLGDFEQWTAIATLNGLSAPWVGQANSQPGDKLLIPSAGGTTTSGLPAPSYDVNVLGVDWYFGPLKQAMLPWTGDIPLIAGPQNLQIALQRRLITVLGDLIYHSNFGSRIPPEVGEVQDTASANLITAFGKSALLGDPRVQSVLSASTTLNATGVGLDAFTAEVQPVGTDGSNGVSVNAVLSPTP